MPVFVCVENTGSLLHLLVKTHYKFRTKNNHCRIIAHKIGTSPTFLLCYMKDGIEP